jgi:hypothetical protein
VGSIEPAEGSKINAYRILMGKPGEERSLERHRLKWHNNIKLDVKVVGSTKTKPNVCK